jgi:hypothetical protein
MQDLGTFPGLFATFIGCYNIPNNRGEATGVSAATSERRSPHPRSTARIFRSGNVSRCLGSAVVDAAREDGWCSGSSRNAVRLPFGTSVQLRRNPQHIKQLRRGSQH